MNTADSAWLTLGNSGVKAANRALLVWWLPFYLIPAAGFTFFSLDGGRNSSIVTAGFAFVMLLPTILAYCWYLWWYRSVKIDLVGQLIRKGSGSRVAITDISYAYTLGKSPSAPILVFGTELQEFRIRMRSATHGRLYRSDLESLALLFSSARFENSSDYRSIVVFDEDAQGSPIRVTKRSRSNIRLNHNDIAQGFIGLERVNFDAGGFAGFLVTLAAEANVKPLKAEKAKKKTMDERVAEYGTRTSKALSGPLSEVMMTPKPPVEVRALSSLRFLLSKKVREEQKRLVAWLRGNGNFLDLSQARWQLGGALVLLAFVLSYPLLCYLLWSGAGAMGNWALQETAIMFFVFGTFLMLFVYHPAFLLVRYALAERYRRVHEGVASELHRRALELSQRETTSEHSAKPVKENAKQTQAATVLVEFGSLDFFLKSDVVLQEKGAKKAAEQAPPVVVPITSAKLARKVPLESRPALIEDVRNIVARRQPLEGWRYSFGVSSIYFNSAWCFYLLVLWIFAFSNASDSYNDDWMSFMVAPVLFVTILTFYLWAKHSQLNLKINTLVRVLELERVWLEGKIRDGQKNSA
ncbi:MAG: hypothetical protein WBA28_04220 [Microbacteriaceae bacterium]